MENTVLLLGINICVCMGNITIVHAAYTQVVDLEQILSQNPYDIVLISLPFSDQREYKTTQYKKLAETTATSVSCSQNQ